MKEPKQKAKQDGTPIQGATWRLMKTHFVVQTNKDKEVKMPIIGEGVVFEEIKSEEPLPEPVKAEAKDDFEDFSSIPF
jgi:hypothetical protein